MERLGKHAIVIGASVGGLLAARALADFYTAVTVLERDRFPLDDAARKGVPQGNHTHGLLARGAEVFEDFFPGYINEVVTQSGGLLGDIARDVRWMGHNVELAGARSDLIGLAASRPVLEGHLRRRLSSMPNVHVIERCSVRGLVSDAARNRISGVSVAIDSEPREDVCADLVVAATGRGSPVGRWLEQLGYSSVESDKVEIGMSYTTRKYRRRPSDLGGKLGLIVAGSAPIWRNGVLLAQEGNRWTVSTGGFLGDDAPDDDEGFLAYLATLPTREIHDIVARSEPLTDYHRYRYAASMRMRYDKLARFPENLLVVGDALCSFNPIYGQGMSVAAQEALLLQQCLRDGPGDLARRFFAAAEKIVDVPWNITVGNDLRHPSVEGPRTPLRRFINWYIGKLHLAATRDSALTRAFLEVANLTVPPASLLMPVNAWRVWRGNLREFFGGRTAVPAATAYR